MYDEQLQKEVLFFPIFKYGHKKYVPFTYAMVIAYLVPTLFIVLLSPLTTNNPLLYQIEYILVAFFYGLLGVLTRSKLRSLLNFIPAFASYLTVQFVVQGLLNLKPPINHPFAMFNTASGPIKNLILTYAPASVSIASYLFIVDLIIVFFIAEVVGFLTATVSTGFWNPKGQFSIFAVIVKVFVIPITLIIIIVLPIFFHGLGSGLDGGAYFLAGASELNLAFNGDGSGGTAAQFSSMDIAALRLHAEKAAYFFSVSDSKFHNLQGNLLVQAVIDWMVSTYPNLAPLQNITVALNLVGSIAELSYVAPELILGLNALTQGFNLTLSYITKGDTSYDDHFNEGLQELNYAFANLTLAWDKTDSSNQHHGIEQAIVKAESLNQIESISNYINLENFTSALNTSVRTVLGIGSAFVQFLNGTYETTVGLANLAQNKLSETDYWMAQAINDFKLSNETLGNIDPGQPVVFEYYSNGDQGASGKTSIEIPVQGIVQLAKDYNSLLIYFAYAGLSSIDMFNGMDGVLTAMGNINWNNTASAANPTFWTDLANSMTLVNNSYNYGLGNLTLASNQASINAGHSYGSLLNPVFKSGSNSFASLFDGLITNLQDNFVDYGYLLNALTYTTYAFRDFSFGSDYFTTWAALFKANGNADNSTSLALKPFAIANFTSSMQNAYSGYEALQLTLNVDPTLKETWSNSLYSPSNNGTILDPSVSGADYSGILILNTTPNDPSNSPLLNIILNLALGDILGSG